MKRSITKIFCILFICTLIIGTFAACGETDNKQTDMGNTVNNTQNEGEQSSDGSGGNSNKITDKPVTLTYWAGLVDHVAATSTNLNEIPLYQELEKRTGVRIEFLHPPIGQENEQFNLMIASNELPDMIERDWLSFPGGPEKAIEDGVILALNDLIDQCAPNFKKVLNENTMIDKLVKTDKGNYYVFPFLRGHDGLLVWNGPQFRKDWLDELGMEVPTTIDEWTEALRAFKEKKGATAPFTYLDWVLSSNNCFLSAYGVARNFYQEDGVVKYGRIEPGYKEFLTLFRQWYEEGLLDPDFAAQDGKAFDAKITGGKTGAFLYTVGGGMGRYLTTMATEDPNFQLVGAPYPTLEEGQIPKFGHKDFPYSPGYSVAITTACKDKEIAAKWLDYGYGEEGHMLFNFGIENKSYKMENGYPKYTEDITNNPDGLPLGQAMAKYIRANYGGPFVQDIRYFEQYLPFPVQMEAVEAWSKAEDTRRMPPVTPTPEESEEFASIMNEVNTYTNEMFLKFVMGQEPIDNFDKYVEQVKKMNIARAIEIQQAALGRFNNR